MRKTSVADVLPAKQAARLEPAEVLRYEQPTTGFHRPDL